MRKFLAISLLAIVSVGALNYVSLHRHAAEILRDDPRNEGVSVFVYYQWFVNPTVVVIDVREVQFDTRSIDVDRIMLQIAEKLKDRSYQSVILASNGKPKFMLEGEYFTELGEEYGVQNPIYTLRTLPENVYELDGSPAFSTWSGGLLGVMTKQMQELADFHAQWFGDAIADAG